MARSAEPDWFKAMAWPLEQLACLSETYDAPIVYAGDIFDRWNASAEVINFALENLPPGYSVPGQHDLPNHNYEEIHKSAYWTLVKSGVLTDLVPGEPVLINDRLVAHGFPWGYPPRPINRPGNQIDLAVVHAFVYNTRENAYPGVCDTSRASVARSALMGFDVAAYGDNHRGFIDTGKGVTICNCGGFMRRKTDERDYCPGVGLLLEDGTVKRHYLDTTKEAFIELTEAEERVGKVLDMTEFVDGLAELGAGTGLEFDEAVKRFLDTNKTKRRVREIVLEATTG